MRTDAVAAISIGSSDLSLTTAPQSAHRARLLNQAPQLLRGASPCPPLFLSLHRRILAGDTAARDELCWVVLPELRRQLTQGAPGLDCHTIEMAIDDALMLYLTKPQKYQPARGSLLAWLSKIAMNRVLDRLRAVRRRANLEMVFGLDLWIFGSRCPSHEPDAEAADAERRRQRQRLVRLARDDRERAFLSARLDGAPLKQQAIALGAEGQTLVAQRTVIKRTLERIRLRAKRGA